MSTVNGKLYMDAARGPSDTYNDYHQLTGYGEDGKVSARRRVGIEDRLHAEVNMLLQDRKNVRVVAHSPDGVKLFELGRSK